MCGGRRAGCGSKGLPDGPRPAQRRLLSGAPQRRPGAYIEAVAAQAVLEVSSLTKAFGRVVAVEDLSFTVERGQVVGLLGPNGAGKTTTLRMMLGLIRPDKGHAFILGEQIRPGSPILRRVGALVEGPGFVPHVSGRRNLELYWRAGGAGLASAHIDDALQLSGLGDAAERKVKTYSHGMRQRLGFAQAVLGKPEFLILDEPVNGLDPQQIVEVREALLRLAAEGTTILLSSHLLAEVEQTCGFVVVLDRGRLVRAGTVAEITAGTDSAYLEVDDPHRGLGAARVAAGHPGEGSRAAEGDHRPSRRRLAQRPRRRARGRRHPGGDGHGPAQPGRGIPRHDGFHIAVIAVEFSKQLHRWRSRILFLICVAVSVLISVGIGATTKGGVADLGPSNLGLFMKQSGLNVGIAALIFTSGLLIPIVFAVSLGEPLASEARWGSLRYLLVRPVPRARLLFAKILVGVVLALVTAVLIPVIATLIGTAYFGWHPITTVAGDFSGPLPFLALRHLAAGAVAWRLAVATLYVVLGSGALVGIAVLVSVATENVLAAVAAGIGTYIISDILNAVSALHRIRPVLPTEYYDKWTQLFRPGASLAGMVHGIEVQACWLAVTIGLAFYIFSRKDILV